MPIRLHLRLLSCSLVLLPSMYSCALLHQLCDLLFDGLVVQALQRQLPLLSEVYPKLLASLSYVRGECDAPNRAYTVGWVLLASRIMMGMDGLAFFMAG